MLVLALLAPTDALACDCAGGPLHVLPRNEATDVPTSSVVVVEDMWHEPSALETVLLDPAGNEVAVTAEDVVAGNSFTRILRPSAPLAPSTTYRVRSGIGEVLEETTFTTGTDSDATAPAAPTMDELETRYDPNSSCGLEFYVFAPLGSSAAEPVVYEVQADSNDTFGSPERILSTWNGLQWGSGPCSQTYAELDFGQTWCFRARSLDGSENASDWTDAACITVGEDIGEGDTDADTDDTDDGDTGEDDVSGGFGCNGSGAPASWAGLVALLGLRRRRAAA